MENMHLHMVTHQCNWQSDKDPAKEPTILRNQNTVPSHVPVEEHSDNCRPTDKTAVRLEH